MPTERVLVRVDDITGTRLSEIRQFEAVQLDAARRAFEEASDKAHHEAWMAYVLIGFSDAIGLTWLILRKRHLQRTLARVLRRLAHNVEPR